MRTIFILTLIVLITGCKSMFITTIKQHCKADFNIVDKAVIVCAVCDSTTGTQLINTIKNVKK